MENTVITPPLKILYFAYYWPPAGGPGVQRTVKFCKYLLEHGIEPMVITLDEKKAHYPTLDPSLVNETLNLKVFKTNTWEPFGLAGIKKNNDQLAFFNAEKVPLKTKLMRFIRGNFFIPDPRRFWRPYALKQAQEIIKDHSISAIITTGPPHSVHLIGLELKKQTGLPWIADFRDPWTDIYFMKTLFRTPLAHLFDKFLEKKVLETADQIVCIGNNLSKILQSKSKRNLSGKFHVITNGYDETDYPNPLPSINNEKFVVSYIGTLAPKHRIDCFLEALENQEKDLFEFWVVGAIEPQTEQLIKNKLTKTTYQLFGRLSHQEAVMKMCESDLLLLSIFDDTQEGSVPAKLFEYLGSGKPILSLGPVNGEADQILQECKAGRTFSFNDLRGISGFLESFPHALNTPNWDAIHRYSRRQLTGKLAQIIQKLCV